MAEEQKAQEEQKKPKEGGLGTIIPEVETFSLGGIECKIRRLKFRETLMLWRIIASAGKRIPWSNIQNLNPTTLTATLLFAIPHAEREFYDFLKAIVDYPEDKEKQIRAYIDQELENEEIMGLIKILIEQEKDSWQKLGEQIKQIAQVFDRKK